MKRLVISIVVPIFVFSVASSDALAQKKGKDARLETTSSRSKTEAKNVEYLTNEVRKELVTLPNFGVFDWLEGFVRPDGTVTLKGEVVRPTTKSDAQRRVEKIEGVERVSNQIEVLPLSGFDDRLRQQVYRRLFSQNSPLFRYGQGVNPSIHIIISNGRCRLKGIVASKGDSDLAYARTRGVEGLFDVSNELKVERKSKK